MQAKEEEMGGKKLTKLHFSNQESRPSLITNAPNVDTRTDTHAVGGALVDSSELSGVSQSTCQDNSKDSFSPSDDSKKKKIQETLQKLINNHSNRRGVFFTLSPRSPCQLLFFCSTAGLIPAGETSRLSSSLSSPLFFHYLH